MRSARDRRSIRVRRRRQSDRVDRQRRRRVSNDERARSDQRRAARAVLHRRHAEHGQWTSLNRGYGVTQFYHGTPFPDGKRYLGGAQDNGTVLGSDDQRPDGWRPIFGGDGGFSRGRSDATQHPGSWSLSGRISARRPTAAPSVTPIARARCRSWSSYARTRGATISSSRRSRIDPQYANAALARRRIPVSNAPTSATTWDEGRIRPMPDGGPHQRDRRLARRQRARRDRHRQAATSSAYAQCDRKSSARRHSPPRGRATAG